METNKRQFYDAPSTTVFEVATEGVIAYSGENTEQFRTYGTTYNDNDFE